MTQHVYARLAGFQLAVIPKAPFRIQHTPDPPDAIDVEYHSPDGRLFACLIPDSGGYRSKVNQQTRSLYDVLDVDAGPDLDHWRIETSKFTCCWPAGYTICSNNFPQDPSPFDLLGPHREMIYVQQPKRLPDVAEMCAPTQKVIRVERTDTSEWIELAYDYDGTPWRQRHEVLTLAGDRIAVTMQAPEEFADAASAVARDVAQSLAAYEEG
ncbi:hypothetical protein Mal4_09990 [Maioricimonas rarisocia]|uniref:Uncharacterized protein n=1 Tax=Maioricimonas rarisocia TaxID=2528026 RepID=A0A517Z2L1_9PLAN|nr:hypothetical protein [Maioricimonas rarisocia]QDU36710.1 hypothetical protein Mal4_09990 [Maioricimonas rarisocia]